MKALVYDVSPFRWVICKVAGAVAQRAYYGALSGLRLVDRPMPELPGPGWVRLKTRLGGICGTDLALITQRQHPATILQAFASFPAVLGHENVATIDQVGDGVDDYRIGQRVCVEPALGCRARGTDALCRQCAAGRSSLCESAAENGFPPRSLIGLNARTGGSWAEYFVAHHSQLHLVNDSISDEVAVLLDPIASAAHAVLRRRPKPGEAILVCGSGIVALGIIAAIRALGHDNPITILARHAFQGELAGALGATSILRIPRGAGNAERYDAIADAVGGRRLAGRFGNQALIGGFDLTFDCIGTGTSLTDAMKWTRSRGTVVLVGTSGIALVDTTPLWFNEIQVVGANGRQIECDGERPIHTYQLVLEWLRAGRLDLSAIPVARYKLSEYRTALGHLLARGRHPIVKAVFDPQSS
ncbi:MAG TPA: alcohol dehydrogenase catalytic domain-containing protein [Phycisphaerae bacterium]|nr:alcohol dehydrogenase catalytic domain-containing protein [Phycisphaerae bacterium]